tara:strand:+ start:242 stop:421 length:180 start_codon:yes stop_codon:yes gene_type:complete
MIIGIYTKFILTIIAIVLVMDLVMTILIAGSTGWTFDDHVMLREGIGDIARAIEYKDCS